MISAAQKQSARQSVRNALANGHLFRPSCCSSCGAPEKPGSDGRSTIHAHHHLGYDCPLDVEWLCPTCHFKHDPRPTGEANGRAVLDVGAVAEIRSTRRQTKALAVKFGVHRTTIQRVRRGDNWIDAALSEEDVKSEG